MMVRSEVVSAVMESLLLLIDLSDGVRRAVALLKALQQLGTSHTVVLAGVLQWLRKVEDTAVALLIFFVAVGTLPKRLERSQRWKLKPVPSRKASRHRTTIVRVPSILEHIDYEYQQLTWSWSGSSSLKFVKACSL